MADDGFDRPVRQLSKALMVAHELAVTLRRDADDARQRALLLEQSMWSAVACVRRMQKGGSAGHEAEHADAR